MNNLTEKLKTFLDTPSEERNWDEGAILLLQLTNNPIMYRNISLNPKGKAEFIEGKLRQFLKVRLEAVAHEELKAQEEQVRNIIQSRTKFKENNPAAEFKAGKRADHDSLPEDIQALYVENLDIVHRMRELHLRLRMLSDSTKLVPDSERKPILDEFISLDKKLHDNWNTYDHFVTKEEKEETKSSQEKELDAGSPKDPGSPKKKQSTKKV